MRKAKYRIWDDYNKKFLGEDHYKYLMIDPFSGELMEVWVSTGELEIEPPYRSSNYNLMQFTGMTDKNGNEIYEGDVLRATEGLGDKVVGVVYWNYGSWEVLGRLFKVLNNLEIIGNIYENPELLKD